VAKFDYLCIRNILTGQQTYRQIFSFRTGEQMKKEKLEEPAHQDDLGKSY